MSKLNCDDTEFIVYKSNYNVNRCVDWMVQVGDTELALKSDNLEYHLTKRSQSSFMRRYFLKGLYYLRNILIKFYML